MLVCEGYKLKGETFGIDYIRDMSFSNDYDNVFNTFALSLFIQQNLISIFRICYLKLLYLLSLAFFSSNFCSILF
jgi:hypothetical protein